MKKGNAAGKAKSPFLKKVKKNRALLLMLLPALLLVIVFSYIPMGGIIIAFKQYNYQDGILGSPWSGFDNFRYMILSKKLWPLTRNTLLYNVAFISFGVIFEVGFAIILNEITRKHFKKVAQSMMFLPHFISWVVVATIMLNIFGDHGVLNNILTSMGMEKFNIYNQAKEWPIVMVIVKLWKSTGYGSVVYLAAIVGISQEIYEAAKIDGANIWQRIFPHYNSVSEAHNYHYGAACGGRYFQRGFWYVLSAGER